MTSLTNLIANTRAVYLKDPNGKVWNNSMLTIALNKGYQQVQKDMNFSDRDEMSDTTFSTVAGTQQYSLPTDFQRVRLARYNGQRLRPKSLVEIKKENATFASGSPYWYYLYGDYIGFYPIPNTTGTIDLEYYKSLPTIDADQGSDLPDDYDDAIMVYAAMYLMRGNSKDNMVASYRQQYEDQLNTLRLKYWYDDQNMRMTYERSRDYRLQKGYNGFN